MYGDMYMYVPAQYVVRTYIRRIPRTPLLRKRQIGGCLLSPGSTLPPSHLCIHAKAHLSSLRLRITHTRTKRVQICRADPRYVHMKLRKVNYSYILHRYLETDQTFYVVSYVGSSVAQKRMPPVIRPILQHMIIISAPGSFRPKRSYIPICIILPPFSFILQFPQFDSILYKNS